MEVRSSIFNEDCIAGMGERLDSESIDLVVTSIPFEELFTYSGKLEDVGNNGSTVDIRAGRFALNMRFMVDAAFRVMRPGTNFCCHIQQLLAYKIQHGFMGRRDFRGAMVDVFGAGGFQFAGEVAIPKNPQSMAQRLNLHSLQFKTGYARDSTLLAPAPNDYVLIFRKPGDHPTPPKCLRDRKNAGGWVTKEEWIRWAEGCWPDVLEIDVLDGARLHKEAKHEKHVCLARGSLVLTRDGHKPIEDVAIGDMVLTHRGRWRSVIAKACNGIRPVVQTEAQGVADLRTTPDHRLWTRSCKGRGGGKGNRWKPGSMSPHTHRRNARTAIPGWLEAQSTVGSYVNLPLPPVEESLYTAEEWWLVGRWLGDGHIDTRGRVHISCAREEVGELVAAMGSRAGFIAFEEYRTAPQVSVRDRGGRLRRLLARYGRGAAGKRLPVEALALDPVKAEALLSGYLSADGHYVARYDRWTASSVSRSLLLGMAMVAQRARGVVASVYAGRPAGTCVIEGRTVQTRPDWILSIPPNNLSAMLLDDGAWKKVRSVEPVGEAEVWDLQVEEDESFVAEGCVVHNCPLQLEIIRRCIALYTNPAELQTDVTVLDPFMGIGSTAWVALGGKSPVTGHILPGGPRNVIGFELKESYYRAAVDNAELACKRAKSSAQDLMTAAGVE